MSISRKSRLTKGAGTAATLTAAGAMAIGVVTNLEGIRLVAYQDVIGVWTACQGVTKDIRKGMKFTREQCDIMFIEELTKHEAGMRRCMKEPDDVPIETYVAFLSFTYNVGIGGFCGSTLRRKANAGDLLGACNELPKWRFAGGKVNDGIINRRKKEIALCLEGVA